MTNEIDLYSRLQDPLDAIDRLGEFFAKSGLFGCEKVEQGKVLAMACLAERRSPLEIMRRNHLYEGKLSMKTEVMLAEFNAAGGKHRIIERTPEAAEIELEHDGESSRFRLTWADAQQEPWVWSRKVDGKGNKVLKTNYASPRNRMQMLWARVVSDGVRAVRPGVVCGVYTPEELSDMPGAGADRQLTMGTATAPATPEEPQAIDVPAEVDPGPDPKPAQTPAKPAPRKKAEPKAEAKSPAPTPTAGTQTAQAGTDIQRFESLLKPMEDKATAYVRAAGVVKPSQTVWDLPPRHITKILSNPDAFIAAVQAHQ